MTSQQQAIDIIQGEHRTLAAVIDAKGRVDRVTVRMK